jgi:hypothetical protein
LTSLNILQTSVTCQDYYDFVNTIKSPTTSSGCDREVSTRFGQIQEVQGSDKKKKKMKILGSLGAEEISTYVKRGEKDLYWTPNCLRTMKKEGGKEGWKWGKAKEYNLGKMNVLFIDLDIYKSDYLKSCVPGIEDLGAEIQKNFIVSPEFVKGELEEEFTKGNRPNGICSSGRGLYLFFLLEPVVRNDLSSLEWEEKVLTYKRVARNISDRFEKFGADIVGSVSPVGFLRFPSSVNSKVTNGRSEVEGNLENTERYTLEELELLYPAKLIDKPKKPKTILPVGQEIPKGVFKGESNFFNRYSLLHARQNDLIKLIEMRRFDKHGFASCRQKLLFYYAQTFQTEISLDELKNVNYNLADPIDEVRVENTTRTLFSKSKGKKRYQFKNSTLIKELNIKDEEMESLQTLISMKEKRRRRAIKYQATKLGSIGKGQSTLLSVVNYYRGQGEGDTTKSNQVIAEIIGVSKRTLQRMLANLRKLGEEKAGEFWGEDRILFKLFWERVVNRTSVFQMGEGIGLDLIGEHWEKEIEGVLEVERPLARETFLESIMSPRWGRSEERELLKIAIIKTGATKEEQGREFKGLLEKATVVIRVIESIGGDKTLFLVRMKGGGDRVCLRLIPDSLEFYDDS